MKKAVFFAFAIINIVFVSNSYSSFLEKKSSELSDEELLGLLKNYKKDQVDEALSLIISFQKEEGKINEYNISLRRMKVLTDELKCIFKNTKMSKEVEEKLSVISDRFTKKYHKEILENGIFLEGSYPAISEIRLQVAGECFLDEFNTRKKYLRIRYRINCKSFGWEYKKDKLTSCQIWILNSEGFSLKNVYIGDISVGFVTGEFFLREEDFMSIDKNKIYLITSQDY